MHKTPTSEQVQKILHRAAGGSVLTLDDLATLSVALTATQAPPAIVEDPKPAPLPPVAADNAAGARLEEIAHTARARTFGTLDPATLANMLFEGAAEAWLRANEARWRKGTNANYVSYIKSLSRFFDGTRLRTIHIGHLLAYQAQRSTNEGNRWPSASGVSNTNHELNTLQQILVMADLWAPIDKLYKPLASEGFKKPKVMSDVEKRRFYAVAASRPEWELCLWVAIIANETSASGVELRNLQFADLLLDTGKPRITVNAATAKCRVRGRSIELNQYGIDAILKCKARAERLGCSKPEHYLFPLRTATNPGRAADAPLYDPTTPASSSWIVKHWQNLRTAAGLPWLTPHCLRHQCITELGEAGAAPETIRQIAGHVSEQMMRHYSHVRRDQQAAAVKLLEAAMPATNNVRGKTSKPLASTTARSRLPLLGTFSFSTTAGPFITSTV